MEPDLAGFADAQRRKRQLLGEEITFFGEVLLEFPVDTPTDPETGRPFDPFAEPTSSAQATSSAKASVAFRPAVAGGQEATPVGLLDSTHVLLVLDSQSSAAASGKVEFSWRDERYKITAQKPDVGWMDRWIVWGRRK